MSGPNDIRDIHLSALIDGELSKDRRSQLEGEIASDPDLACRVDEMRADKEMLKRVFAPVAQQQLPKQWLAAIHTPRRLIGSRTTWRQVVAIAAVLLVAVIGTFSYLNLRPNAPMWIVDEALNARQDMSRPQQVILVAAKADVSHYDAVLKQAVGARVRVPDMRRAGYRLASIRVFARDKGRAAELVYRDTQNRVFTLYVSHSDGSVDFIQLERRGLRVCLWRDDQISTVMAGNVSTAAMQRLAILAYGGMTA